MMMRRPASFLGRGSMPLYQNMSFTLAKKGSNCESMVEFFLGLRLHLIHARLSFKKAFKKLNVTSRLKFTCFSHSLVKHLDGTKRLVIVVGTTTGQIFYGTFTESGVDIEMTTSKEVGYVFVDGII
ncbi:hypothetical protein ANCCAN_28401 [Ancylostoma caninum]|uniref:Uncharacterized protein n=1 Tax=Ancylostoma caninum TaxID=29170 RepID=A0A368F1A7_ANCCA|nr:hypothetical protein ANCCAN_28401 [Ancylostoma caninum]